MKQTSFVEEDKYKKICTLPPIQTEIYWEDKSKKERINKGEGTISLFTQGAQIGGLFLKSSVPFKLDSKVHLNFTLPVSEKTIHIVGTIINHTFDNHAERLGIGIKFERINFDDQKIIEDYLKSKMVIATELDEETYRVY